MRRIGPSNFTAARIIESRAWGLALAVFTALFVVYAIVGFGLNYDLSAGAWVILFWLGSIAIISTTFMVILSRDVVALKIRNAVLLKENAELWEESK